MKNKLSKGLSLSLSANPKHLIKGSFSAVAKGFTEFFEKNSKQETNLTNIAFKSLDVVRQYAALLERRVQRGTRARKTLVVTRQANSLGRSMIEMLGVLAIIGVLSVGGIAGYSKAMEMYKMDKALEEYNFLIQGLMEHSEQFVKMSKQNTQMTGITDFVTAANLVPATWKKVTIYDFIDSVGNMVGTYIRGGLWAIEIHPGGAYGHNDTGTQINESFSLRMCESIFRDLAQPLHSSVHDAFIYRSKQGSIVFYGDKNCADGKKCLHNLTVAEINQTCKSCQKSSERCSIAIEFE